MSNNKKDKLFEWGKFLAPRVCVLILGIILLCFNGNWKSIIYVKQQPTDLSGLLTVLLTPLNVVLLGLSVIVALLILLFLMGRLLFTPLEEVNIMGVGYKQARKVEKKAIEEMDIYRKNDVLRMSIIDAVGGPDFLAKIADCYNAQTFVLEEYAILLELSSLVESAYNSHLPEVNLIAGVVVVENEVLDNSQMVNLPSSIRQNLDKCYRYEMVASEKGRILAIPLKLEDGATSFCIYYMSNTEGIFNKADETLIMNIWRMIKNEVQLMALESQLVEEITS